MDEKLLKALRKKKVIPFGEGSERIDVEVYEITSGLIIENLPFLENFAGVADKELSKEKRKSEALKKALADPKKKKEIEVEEIEVKEIVALLNTNSQAIKDFLSQCTSLKEDIHNIGGEAFTKIMSALVEINRPFFMNLQLIIKGITTKNLQAKQ